MEALKGHDKVVLVLGTCPLRGHPDLVKPSSRTEKVIAALSVQGYKPILIDLRKTCRRTRSDKGCYSWTPSEANMMTVATALELLIAVRHFEIRFCSVLSFGEVWFEQFPALTGLLKQYDDIDRLPHFHVDTHLGWFGTTASYVNGRVAATEATRAYRRLAQQLSDARILPVDSRTIYDSWHDRFSVEFHLLPWDAPLVEGHTAPKQTAYSASYIADFFALEPPGQSIGEAIQPPQPTQKRMYRKVDWEAVRPEIMQRSENGETSTQIEQALLLKGISTSACLIARKRKEWDSNPTNSMRSAKTPRLERPRLEDLQFVEVSTGKNTGPPKFDWEAVRPEIMQRSENGETLAHIAQALLLKGIKKVQVK